MNILDRIIERKKQRVNEIKKVLPVEHIKKEALSLSKTFEFPFYRKIKRLSHEPMKIIAEIKKASPLKGLLRDYNLEEMADIYVSSGIDAISIITEEDFFLGNPDYIKIAKKKYPNIPILRKDFIFDEYQIYESKVLGADALLLIADILSKEESCYFFRLAKSLGMDVLFEIHDEEGLKKALLAESDIIGINNRDLKTLQINIETTLRLKKSIPEGRVIVSESGISKREDVIDLIKAGIDAILVGTSIVLSENPAKKIKELKFGL